LRQATRLFESHRKLTKRDLVTIEPDDILKSSVFHDADEERAGPRAPRTEAEASVGI
jgi:hypothetical protein